ncbi:unnamed protein product [Xylocopa violacea]|uniref:Uncharacterized protein n=1 Tax=Xylocopa violacea TaxID=135666 RepID=A0ABP1NQY7_XYLVO
MKIDPKMRTKKNGCEEEPRIQHAVIPIPRKTKLLELKVLQDSCKYRYKEALEDSRAEAEFLCVGDVKQNVNHSQSELGPMTVTDDISRYISPSRSQHVLDRKYVLFVFWSFFLRTRKTSISAWLVNTLGFGKHVNIIPGMISSFNKLYSRNADYGVDVRRMT